MEQPTPVAQVQAWIDTHPDPEDPLKRVDQPPALRRGTHVPRADMDAIRHAYVEGVHTKRGKDGRVFRLCRVCDLPANAGRHRSAASVAAKGGTGGDITERVRDRHPYRAGAQEMTDAAGRRRVLCSRCGKPANSPRHRGQAESPRPVLVSPPGPEAPIPQVTASTGRAARNLPAAELALLAIAVDQVLALPPEAVGWRLRLRLADIRGLVNVPEYPTLQAPDAPADPDAPAPSLVEDRPELQARRRPVAVEAKGLGIIRGIRSDRIKNLARRAVDQGWEVSVTGSGHLRLAKGSQVIIGSATAETGSGHGWGNLKSQARRAGLDVTGL